MHDSTYSCIDFYDFLPVTIRCHGHKDKIIQIDVEMYNEMTIINDKGRLGQVEIAQMLMDAETFRDEDEKVRKAFE